MLGVYSPSSRARGPWRSLPPRARLGGLGRRSQSGRAFSFDRAARWQCARRRIRPGSSQPGSRTARRSSRRTRVRAGHGLVRHVSGPSGEAEARLVEPIDGEAGVGEEVDRRSPVHQRAGAGRRPVEKEESWACTPLEVIRANARDPDKRADFLWFSLEQTGSAVDAYTH